MNLYISICCLAVRLLHNFESAGVKAINLQISFEFSVVLVAESSLSREDPDSFGLEQVWNDLFA